MKTFIAYLVHKSRDILTCVFAAPYFYCCQLLDSDSDSAMSRLEE